MDGDEKLNRVRLPNRRQSILSEFEWRGSMFTLCVGFDEQGRAKEAFLDGARKIGGDLQAVLADACILVSLMLQSGCSAEYLSHRLVRNKSLDEGNELPPASPVGVIADLIAEMEIGE